MKDLKISDDYKIVAAGIVFLAFHSAMGIYGFGIFNQPIRNEFGWLRGPVAFGATILFLVAAISNPFIGQWTHRYGPSRVILGTGIAGGIGYSLLSVLRELWHLYILYGLIGVAFAGVSIIPVSTLISNRFVKNRGTMIGIASMGIGGGGMVFAPLFGSWIIPHFGWRTACLIFAILIFSIIIPLGIWMMRVESPGKSNSAETNSKFETTMSQSVVSGGSSFKMVLKTSAFWLIALAFALTNFCSVGMVQHYVNFFTDIGVATANAARVLGMVGIGSTIGKFFFGWLTDRISPKHSAFSSFLFIAAALIMLRVVKNELIMYPSGLSLGLGMGGWAPTMTMLTSDTFGLGLYSIILGMLLFFLGAGASIGPLVIGYLYDRMQTYDQALIIMLGLCVIGAVCVLGVRRKNQE